MMKKIIAVFLIPFFLFSVSAPALAGSAIILTDEQLDDVHAEGLFFDFEASFGDLNDVFQNNGGGPKIKSTGGTSHTTNPGVQYVTFNKGKAPKVPKINKPQTPKIPDIKVPNVPSIPSQASKPTIPNAPDPVIPEIPSVPNIVKPEIPQVDISSATPVSLSSNTVSPIDPVTFNKGFINQNVPPQDIVQNIANVIPAVQTPPEVTALAMATPVDTSNLLNNVTPQTIINSNPAGNIAPIDVITPPAAAAPVVQNITPDVKPMPAIPTITPTANSVPVVQNTTPAPVNVPTIQNITPKPTTVNTIPTNIPPAPTQLAANTTPPVDMPTNTVPVNNVPTANTTTPPPTLSTTNNLPSVEDLAPIAQNAAANVINNNPLNNNTIQLDVAATQDTHGSVLGLDLNMSNPSQTAPETPSNSTNLVDQLLAPTLDTTVRIGQGGTNIVNVSDSSQANLSSLVNVNAAGSIVPVILNITINIDSTVESIRNSSNIDILNLNNF